MFDGLPQQSPPPTLLPSDQPPTPPLPPGPLARSTDLPPTPPGPLARSTDLPPTPPGPLARSTDLPPTPSLPPGPLARYPEAESLTGLTSRFQSQSYMYVVLLLNKTIAIHGCQNEHNIFSCTYYCL